MSSPPCPTIPPPPYYYYITVPREFRDWKGHTSAPSTLRRSASADTV